MNHYFFVAGIKIPIELKPLYEEVSRCFEKQVMDSVKNKKENRSEKDQKIFKKSNHSRRLHQTSWEEWTRSN